MSKEDTVSDFADGYAGDWLPHKSSCKCEECSRERQIKAMEKDIRDLKVERGYLLFRLSAARERIAELEAAESRETTLQLHHVRHHSDCLINDAALAPESKPGEEQGNG